MRSELEIEQAQRKILLVDCILFHRIYWAMKNTHVPSSTLRYSLPRRDPLVVVWQLDDRLGCGAGTSG